MTKPPKVATERTWERVQPQMPEATRLPDAVAVRVEPAVHPALSDYETAENTMIELLRSIDRRLANIEKKLP
jgi:hypothetical protein